MAVAIGLIRNTSSDASHVELDRQITAIAALISDRVERDVEAGRPVRVPQVTNVQNLQLLVGAEAVFYYKGLPLSPGSTAPEDNLPPLAAEQVDFDELANDGVQRIEFTIDGSDRKLVGAAAPVMLDDTILGAAVIARPPAAFNSPIGRTVAQVLIATAIGLVVAIALSLYLTSRVLRPMRAMQAATRAVAAGNMELRLSPTGTQELDELSAAFNRMVEQLGERDRLARDFLMKITHDLRTPLTAIRGHSAALSDGVVPEHDVARSLAAIEGEAARLETMVADLLDLAKIDAHRFRMELDEVAPAAVLRQAFDAFEAQAAERGVRYECHLAPLPSVITDGARVQQIIANLLENALRWAPEGGTVRLEAHAEPDGGIVASVRDDGPGIEAEDRERVFEPFLSRETPEGDRGSGLGLAISRQLARALGGDVSVESRVGWGSRFTLRLPPAGPPGDQQVVTAATGSAEGPAPA
jgi:signal transduction histidine kinase